MLSVTVSPCLWYGLFGVVCDCLTLYVDKLQGNIVLFVCYLWPILIFVRFIFLFTFLRKMAEAAKMAKIAQRVFSQAVARDTCASEREVASEFCPVELCVTCFFVRLVSAFARMSMSLEPRCVTFCDETPIQLGTHCRGCARLCLFALL